MGNERQQLGDLARDDVSALFSYLCRATQNHAQAEDLLQDALMNATKSLHTFDAERGPMRAWLFRIGQNRLRAWFTEHRKQHRLREEIALVNDEEPQTSTPLQFLEGRSAEQVLESALAALSDTQRQVLLLRTQEGYSCRDIAELLKLTPNAVSMHLHKARARIRTHLESEELGALHAM